MTELDSRISSVYKALPPRTLFLVNTAHGDIHTMEQLRNSPIWGSKEQKTLRGYVETAKQALTFFCIK